MIIACKCLNISANIVDDNDVDITKRIFSQDDFNSLKSKSNEKILQFLKEAFGPFSDPTNLKIQIRHEDLTGKRHVVAVQESQSGEKNNWLLTQCLNCEHIVFGTKLSPNKPFRTAAAPEEPPSASAELIFNSKLLTSLETINGYKANDNFSKIYKIVIRQPSMFPFAMASSSSPPRLDPAKLEAHNLLNSPSPRLKPLSSLLRERLRRETEATEMMIRRFTEDQFAALKLFRQTAESEFQQLAQKVLAEDAARKSSGGSLIPSDELSEASDRKLISISILSGGSLLEAPPLTPDSGGATTPMSIGNGPPQQHLRALVPSSATASSRLPSGASGGKASFRDKMGGRRRKDVDEDDDCLFGMDGYFPSNVDVDQHQQMSDFEEDFDENAEDEFPDQPNQFSGRNIPGRGRPSNSSIAKSLPIPTPALPDRYEDDEVERFEDGVDIAASIKALAKSVHGDAVFGDLPRPRFSTQI